MPSPRRVLLHLVACAAIAMGAAMSHVWGLGARQRRGLRRLEIQLDTERIEAQIRILSAWFRRSRRRPRHTRREWLLILEYAERWGLSAAQIAREFLVSPATVYRWLERRRQAGFAAPLPIKPVPPCRRIADNRRQLVADMALAGFDKDRTIERHLHLQGEMLSARSAGRFRENPLGPAPKPERRRKKRAAEIPEMLDACAAHVFGPERLPRPRVARLVRTLANAFTEGIAADTQRRLDEGSLYEAEHALLRSRRAEQLAILLSRFARIPPRHRPRYTDTERAEILALKYRFRLSNPILAAWFLLDPGTLCDWNRDVDRPEERKLPLVRPLSDVDTALASVAQDLPFVPKRLRQSVEETLAALARKVPVRKRLTRRLGKTKPAAAATKQRNLAPIRACYPNHYWSADLTTLELGRQFYLATIIDLYSRDVLAWQLFAKQPSGNQVTALFDQAANQNGKPAHFVSDQGGQFAGEALEAALAERGVGHRRGAVGQHGSIAIIERLWRTAKECLDLKSVRPNVPEILRERVAVVIDYYRTKRPHSALGNAAPAQVYRGETSHAANPQPAPRGWRGEPSPPVPFVIRHAFPLDRKLPYLERAA